MTIREKRNIEAQVYILFNKSIANGGYIIPAQTDFSQLLRANGRFASRDTRKKTGIMIYNSKKREIEKNPAIVE